MFRKLYDKISKRIGGMRHPYDVEYKAGARKLVLEVIVFEILIIATIFAVNYYAVQENYEERMINADYKLREKLENLSGNTVERLTKENAKEKVLLPIAEYRDEIRGRTEGGDNFALELSYRDENGKKVPLIKGPQLYLEFELRDKATGMPQKHVLDMRDYFGDEQVDEVIAKYVKEDYFNADRIWGRIEEDGTIFLSKIEMAPVKKEGMYTIIEMAPVEEDGTYTTLLCNSSQEDNTLLYDSFSEDFDEEEIPLRYEYLQHVHLFALNTDEKFAKEASAIKSDESDDTFFETMVSYIHYRDIEHYEIADSKATLTMKLYGNPSKMAWDRVWIIPLSSRSFLRFWTITFVGVLVSTVKGYRKRNEQKLKQRKTRDLFINAMAHELKTPAAVLHNTAEYLESGRRPEKQEHYLSVLQQESVHINQLLGQMLTYTRMSDKKQSLDLKETDLQEVVNERLGLFRDLIEEKGELVEVLDDRHEKVWCDRQLIEMVIDNMITNALKYGDDGGKLEIRLSNNGIRIYNEGPKLSQEELQEVWTPMYRGDKARTDDSSSGMGLAISAEILELHNGRYGVGNKREGVEFYFYLPFLPPDFI
ncbi:MAG: HAMP domain-containing histidine kinase [Lachnospiraceae bacterium]|nr:HAMP domain-containing histidine kinase [Lachnospiraceae bacterium]